MRIALVNWSRRLAGGAETTLAGELPTLAAAGHTLALWYEVDRPTNRATIPLPGGGPTWCVRDLGASAALAGLRAWKPDVLYVHGFLNPGLERRLLDVAPAVFFAHNYYGTCISGTKAFSFPTVHPCPHRFGWRCLIRYYPRRVGGLSPVTMLRLFRTQARRLKLLRRYRALLVLSQHMRAEYLRHGFPTDRVVLLPPPPIELPTIASIPGARRPGPPWRLLFVGRADRLKGGSVLLKAAPLAAGALSAPLEVTVLGDGPALAQWRRLALRIARGDHSVTVHFPGWQADAKLADFFRGADLLVMPSLWPEPFGRTGLEAAAYGVPCAAFAVGGIPDWLHEGVNGHLAPGDPPTVEGLADAIARALRDPGHLDALRHGALAAVERANAAGHVRALLEVLDRAAGAA